MSPIRVLGFCGLVSAGLSTWGGFADMPMIIGLAGLVMVGGNLYAMIGERT